MITSDSKLGQERKVTVSRLVLYLCVIHNVKNIHQRIKYFTFLWFFFHPLFFFLSRFKTLLANRPCGENTCIEISNVKYHIFQVSQASFYHHKFMLCVRPCMAAVCNVCLSLSAGDAVSVLWRDRSSAHQEHRCYGGLVIIIPLTAGCIINYKA